jgi:hypothetical protein
VVAGGASAPPVTPLIYMKHGIRTGNPNLAVQKNSERIARRN